MTQEKTQQQQYQDLIADLKAGTHRSADKDRPVQVWDEYDMPADAVRAEATPTTPAILHPYAGKHVVTIQYGGHDGGDGGLLKDFAFDPSVLVQEEEKEAEPASKADVKVADKAVDKPAKG